MNKYKLMIDITLAGDVPVVTSVDIIASDFYYDTGEKLLYFYDDNDRIVAMYKTDKIIGFVNMDNIMWDSVHDVADILKGGVK